MINSESVTLEAIATFAAATIAFFAFALSTYVARGQRLAQISQMRLGWEELQDSWGRAIVLWDPGFWYYSDIDVGARAEVEALQKRVRRIPDGADYMEEVRSETRHVRRVVRYFAYVAEAVHAGKLGPNDAYRIFGPEVARNRSALVWMSGRGYEEPTAMGRRADDAWSLASDQIPYTYFHAEQRDVVSLVNLMSAIAAKRGDLRAHFLLFRAQELQRRLPSGITEGIAIRREVARSTRGLTAMLRRPIRRRLALCAESIRWSGIKIDPDPLLRREDWRYLRLARFWPWAARARFNSHAQRLGVEFYEG